MGQFCSCCCCGKRRKWMKTKDLKQYREDFEPFDLSEREIRKFWDLFQDLDRDGSGEITMDEMLEVLKLDATHFNQRVFSVMGGMGGDAEPSVPGMGENGKLNLNSQGQIVDPKAARKKKGVVITFQSFVTAMWNYCSLGTRQLARFAFDLYDLDKSGSIDQTELVQLLRDIYGPQWERHGVAQKVHGKFYKLGGKGVDVDFEHFGLFCQHHPALLQPCFAMQRMLQERFLGLKYWEMKTAKRVEKHGDETFGSVEQFKQAQKDRERRKAEEAKEKARSRFSKRKDAKKLRTEKHAALMAEQEKQERIENKKAGKASPDGGGKGGRKMSTASLARAAEKFRARKAKEKEEKAAKAAQKGRAGIKGGKGKGRAKAAKKPDNSALMDTPPQKKKRQVKQLPPLKRVGKGAAVSPGGEEEGASGASAAESKAQPRARARDAEAKETKEGAPASPKKKPKAPKPQRPASAAKKAPKPQRPASAASSPKASSPKASSPKASSPKASSPKKKEKKPLKPQRPPSAARKKKKKKE